MAVDPTGALGKMQQSLNDLAQFQAAATEIQSEAKKKQVVNDAIQASLKDIKASQ